MATTHGGCGCDEVSCKSSEAVVLELLLDPVALSDPLVEAGVACTGVVAAALADTEEETAEEAEAEAVAVAVAVAEAEAEVAEAASDVAAAAAAAPNLYASTCDHEPGAAHKSTARVTPSKMWHSSSTCSAGHMRK